MGAIRAPYFIGRHGVKYPAGRNGVFYSLGVDAIDIQMWRWNVFRPVARSGKRTRNADMKIHDHLARALYKANSNVLYLFPDKLRTQIGRYANPMMGTQMFHGLYLNYDKRSLEIDFDKYKLKRLPEHRGG